MDDNLNMWPNIYSRLFSSNPIGMSMATQVNIFRQAIRRETGADDLASRSTYLTKRVFGRVLYDGYGDWLKSVCRNWSNVRDEKMARYASCSSAESQYSIAFVWDIDDITMLSRRHMAEISYLQPDINSMSLYELVNTVLMSVGISQSEEIESGAISNILDAPTDSKYIGLQNLYNEVSNEAKKKRKSIINHELLEKCGIVGEKAELCETASKCQEIHNQRWICAKKCLNLVKRRSAKSKTQKYANIVITKEGVANAAGQLLVAQQSSAVKLENIFSRHDDSEAVWEKIRRRFGKQCLLVLITSNELYSYNLKDKDIKIITIRAKETFDHFYTGLRDHLLK